MEEVIDNNTQEEPRASVQQEEELKALRERRAKQLEEGFWLTEAQKIVIQDRLPRNFCFLPVAHNSRLLNNFKLLEEESNTFKQNRRGRPEGSRKNAVGSPTKSRKSSRVRNEANYKPKEAEESRNEPSE
jgi:hypothetical protein